MTKDITTLHTHAQNGNIPMLEKILSQQNSNINQQDAKSGNSALHYAVCWGEVEAVQFLLGNNANPNQKNNLGETPFHYALHYGTTKTKESNVEILLKNNGNPDIKNNLDLTPLNYAQSRADKTLFNLMSPYSNPSAYESLENTAEEPVTSDDIKARGSVSSGDIETQGLNDWITYLIQNEILPWAIKHDDKGLIEGFASYISEPESNQDRIEILGDSDIEA